MPKRVLEPSTVLYPVPIVLVTCSDSEPDIITVNRIASLAAEPPIIGISLRPARLSHQIISRTREFVVNLPTAKMLAVADFCGTTTGRNTDKFSAAKLTAVPALEVGAPLIAECPVNIECRVIQIVNLSSHDLFSHESKSCMRMTLLDSGGEIDYQKANPLA